MDITSRLAKVITSPDVTNFLLGTSTLALETTGVARIDAAGWKIGNEMLVNVVYLEYSDSSNEVSVLLPQTATGIKSTVWGEEGWTVSGDKLIKSGLKELEVDMIIVTLEQ